MQTGAQYIVNEPSKKPLPAGLPFIVGGLFVLLFLLLSIWQTSRGFEKRATHAAYQDEVSYVGWQEGQAVRPFQQLQVRGRFDTERQLLLENIIVDSQLGHYVITPMVFDADRPPLLVNRGWLRKDQENADLSIADGVITVRGRVGALPRSAFKMGDAVTASSEWPKTAVYPTLEDAAAAYGTALQPFVLLMDEGDNQGFYRRWVPAEFGPEKHFAYALQWLAMGTVLLSLLIWNYRKKRFV